MAKELKSVRICCFNVAGIKSLHVQALHSFQNMVPKALGDLWEGKALLLQELWRCRNGVWFADVQWARGNLHASNVERKFGEDPFVDAFALEWRGMLVKGDAHWRGEERRGERETETTLFSRFCKTWRLPTPVHLKDGSCKETTSCQRVRTVKFTMERLGNARNLK